MLSHYAIRFINSLTLPMLVSLAMLNAPARAENSLPVSAAEANPVAGEIPLDFYRNEANGDVWRNVPAWQLSLPTNGTLPKDMSKYGLRAIYLTKYACWDRGTRDWMPANIAMGVYYCTNPKDRKRTVDYLRMLANKLATDMLAEMPKAGNRTTETAVVTTPTFATTGLRERDSLPVSAAETEPKLGEIPIDYYRDEATGNVWGDTPAWRLQPPPGIMPPEIGKYGLRAIYLTKYACWDQGTRDWMPSNVASGIYYCTNPEDREITINFLRQLADKLEKEEAGGGNIAPVASPVSGANSVGGSIQISLIGSDADGDTLSYELLSPANGAGYTDAYIVGNTLHVAFTSPVVLQYHVTDGQQFSEPANITLTMGTAEERSLGMNIIDPRTYALFDRGQPSTLLFGAPGQAPTLPRSFDLSDNFPPAGSQGNQGSCVAWATAYALKSYQERMEVGWSLTTADGAPDYHHIFSPAFIYNQINGGRDEGSDPATALQLIVNTGAATWATMPYNDTDYRTQPSSAAFAEAAQFKGKEMKVADGTQAIKAALANRLPVVAGIFVYDSLMGLSSTNAVYNTKGVTCDPSNQCGHAVTIVGYDDDKFGGAFKIINSWGRNWGDNGYFWLPYDFARQTAPWPGSDSNGSAPLLMMSLYLEDADNTGTIEPTPPVPVPINTDLPNLQVENWSASYDARPGGEGTLQYSVINTGTASVPANMIDVNMMLSEDLNITSNDIYVVYETVPFDLEIGESAYRDETNAVNFVFPQNIPAGVYYMGVWVDDLNKVQESNEEDNFSQGENLVAITNTLPDLVVETWYTEWDDAGDGSLEYTVTNAGVSPTTLTDWDINLVLSSDEIIGNGDEWVLFYEQGNYLLQPGGQVYRDVNSRAYFNIYVDAFKRQIPAGTYYMALWVDDLNREIESDETNNYSLGGSLVSIGLRARQKGENYNGKPLPARVLLRKVQILDTAEGKRSLRILEDEANKPLYDKQMRSANQVVFPLSRKQSMPTRHVPSNR